MKKFVLLSFLLSVGLFTSCNDDDDSMNGPKPTGNETTYTLNEKAVAGISGTAKFIENTDNSITVELNLNNTPAGGSHPAHIHFDNAATGGDVAITLGAVDGSTGMSTITFSTLNDGTAISYSELLDFDGYINVHLSADELGTIVAQGDIGQNELTGESKSYALEERAVDGISGSVTFSERVNGEALAEISLTGTPDGGSHPAHIHFNSFQEGGGIAYTFTAVDGSTGMSLSNVSELNDGNAFGYSDILDYDGYVNVHLSASELSTIVAQGNIGSNSNQ